MSDVFISYTRDDRAHADRLKSRLEALGLAVFLDVDGGIEAGSAFPQRIADEITATKAVVAIWTPHALTRDWCRRECFLARQLGKLTPVAVATLTPSDLREFVDASYESLEDFVGQEKHFGWSQVLGSIARAVDRWAEANPVHPDAIGALERAARVRRASIECRPAAQAAPTSGLTGAAAIWARTRNSEDVDELQRFADSFVGTAEGLEARTRIAQLNMLDSLRRAQRGQDKIEIINDLQKKWPNSQWNDLLSKELLEEREWRDLKRAEEQREYQARQQREREESELAAARGRAYAESEAKKREELAAAQAAEEEKRRNESAFSMGCQFAVGVAVLVVLLSVLSWLAGVWEFVRCNGALPAAGCD